MDPADITLTLRVLGSLVLVLGLIAIAARMVRRSRVRAGATLRVLERTGLTREASVAVVEVAGRRLVLGVTPQTVSVLTEAPVPDESEQDSRQQESPPAPSRLEELRRESRPEELRRESRQEEFEDLLRQNEDHERTRLADLLEPLTRPEAPRPDRPWEDGVLLPPSVRMDQHPDLASALRAAGRVAEPSPPRRRPADRRTSDRRSTDARRAAVRHRVANRQRTIDHQASVREAALREAVLSEAGLRQEIIRQAADRRSPAGAATGTAIRDGAVVGQAAERRASGSVLDPGTWRQGLEALRDLTARRT